MDCRLLFLSIKLLRKRVFCFKTARVRFLGQTTNIIHKLKFDKNVNRPRLRNANNRSNHQRCSMKKAVLRNFTKTSGKHLCQGLLFNKVAGLRLSTLLKKRLWHRSFSVKFAKLVRTTFLQNTSGRLRLY